MHKVEVSKYVEAPLQAVWDAYTDHASWTKWAGLGEVVVVSEGAPTRNGHGCIRAFKTFGITMVEERVETFEPPNRMTYAVIRRGPPMRNHLGEVSFTKEGAGTRISWRCQFRPILPGTGSAIVAIVNFAFHRALTGLVTKRFRQFSTEQSQAHPKGANATTTTN